MKILSISDDAVSSVLMDLFKLHVVYQISTDAANFLKVSLVLLCVCACVYVHAHNSERMCVCICMCMCAFPFVCMCVCIRTCASEYVHVRVFFTYAWSTVCGA